MPRPKAPQHGAKSFDQRVRDLTDEVRELYSKNADPWVIGYSGGKDSTAVLQLVWNALLEVPEVERTKPVYVVTTDTLVENPVVSAWVEQSLEQMRLEAEAQRVPVRPNLLRPPVKDSFWVNLIGKGYPAPRHKFRWCTERLKIKPTSTFIENRVSTHGEVILFLGARKAESATRAASLGQRAARKRGIEGLTPHPELPGCMVYTPIEEWANDDVWHYLLQHPNPWRYDNDQLMAMYRGATADNECPVVVDTSTPSCGNSRFGCWVCTLVEEDKSMAAMIQNDYEKEWMLPLLEFRNYIDFSGQDKKARDHERRDFRRIWGGLSHLSVPDDKARAEDSNWLEKIQLVHGPYTQSTREELLERLLRAQVAIRSNPDSPASVGRISLITPDELAEIRRIWLEEKHEIEDSLPRIYERVTGEPFPLAQTEERPPFSAEDFELLRTVCAGNPLRYEMLRNLLDVEWSHRLRGKRYGLFEEIEKIVESCFFQNEADALDYVRRKLAQRYSNPAQDMVHAQDHQEPSDAANEAGA